MTGCKITIFWDKPYDIKKYRCVNPLTQLEEDNEAVFTKRFLSNSFKKSLKEESCDPSFIRPLETDILKKVEQFITDKPKIYEKFVDYVPKSIDSIYNARIGIPENKIKKDVASSIPTDVYFREIEINEKLNELGFDTKAMPYWTVQFISENFHCIDGALSYKFYRIMDF